MAAKNRYHRQLRNALLNDGWTITHDPLRLRWGGRDLYVDLGAERLLGAEKGEQKIAVEIQSFLGTSDMNSLEKAVGQFVVYHGLLAELEPERTLYLAVDRGAFANLFQEPVCQLVIHRQGIRVVVFDPFEETIEQWTA